MTPTPPPGFLTARQAAEALSPVVRDVDPAHLLVDWRRYEPGYRRRISRPPKFIRGPQRRVFYDAKEVARVVAELASGAPT